MSRRLTVDSPMFGDIETFKTLFWRFTIILLVGRQLLSFLSDPTVMQGFKSGPGYHKIYGVMDISP